MTGSAKPQPEAPIPADDPNRHLTIATPDSANRHVSVAGDTYTILVSGAETSGRYCLIDMRGDRATAPTPIAPVCAPGRLPRPTTKH